MSQQAPRTAVEVTGHTQLVGLFGWPVEHSISPPMQNAALLAVGLDWCYLPFAVPPERLADALRGVQALGFRGVNATVPHKQALLSLVDELTPEAQAIGAVNTLLLGPRTVGHNTDAAGFLHALRDTGYHPEGQRVLMLGAGGAARAVGYALLSAGARLTILNRTVDRAVALAADLSAVLSDTSIEAGALDQSVLAQRAPQAELVVNTTMVGMSPHGGACPWPDEVPYPEGVPLFDLIYSPPETRLMALARRTGAQATNGLTMLVHQGAEAFRLWTGVEPPVDVMLRACLHALGRS
jgi:shikimate dehydrogenase